MSEIDPIIHQPIRLRIMAALVALGSEEQLEFTALRNLLGATDGNLGAHLLKLEDAKYIQVTKTFIGRKPKTFIAATLNGRKSFQDHIAALRAIIGEQPSA
jgi:DNA-binding MarR family transcriptional regulator